MMSYSAREHDTTVHNVPSKTLWLESQNEALQFQQRVREEGMAAIPKEERPGAVRYLKENGFGALFSEPGKAQSASFNLACSAERAGSCSTHSGVFAVVAVIHRLAIWKQNEETWLVRGTSARWMLLFLALTFALSLFHAGIGTPVIESNAIIPALFLPLLLTFIWISERYRRQLQRTRYANLVNRIYLAMMTLPIAWISIEIIKSIRSTIA